jgi:hypothetical protein
VFERFTDGARQCVVLSQEEAYAVEADAVGTEHMLLGLLDQGDELVAEALRGAGFPERAAQVSPDDPPPVRTVHIPLLRRPPTRCDGRGMNRRPWVRRRSVLDIFCWRCFGATTLPHRMTAERPSCCRSKESTWYGCGTE